MQFIAQLAAASRTTSEMPSPRRSPCLSCELSRFANSWRAWSDLFNESTSRTGQPRRCLCRHSPQRWQNHSLSYCESAQSRMVNCWFWEVHAHPRPSPTALCLPAGYMNTCGPAVKLALRHFQITEKENIFVVHDEMEMKIGRWRPVESGLSLHGHNGLKSIERSLQGRDRFQRVKIGIGRPLSHDQQDVSDYVLGKFSEQELDTLRALAK